MRYHWSEAKSLRSRCPDAAGTSSCSPRAPAPEGGSERLPARGWRRARAGRRSPTPALALDDRLAFRSAGLRAVSPSPARSRAAKAGRAVCSNQQRRRGHATSGARRLRSACPGSRERPTRAPRPQRGCRPRRQPWSRRRCRRPRLPRRPLLRRSASDDVAAPRVRVRLHDVHRTNAAPSLPLSESARSAYVPRQRRRHTRRHRGSKSTSGAWRSAGRPRPRCPRGRRADAGPSRPAPRGFARSPPRAATSTRLELSGDEQLPRDRDRDSDAPRASRRSRRRRRARRAASMARPDAARRARRPRVNIFLYQVTPSAAWRNEDLPTRNSDGGRVSRPRIGLDLHYLITFYGAEARVRAAAPARRRSSGRCMPAGADPTADRVAMAAISRR